MVNYPRIIASSVIRSALQGESHGGIYIVDLEKEEWHQVIDWNDQSITWTGRGGDRGLRGIAFFLNQVFMAASDEIFVYDRYWNIVESYRNRYMKWCHEIFTSGDSLFVTSTAYDAILEFNLSSKTFVRGYYLRFGKLSDQLYKFGFDIVPKLCLFDPNSDRGPPMRDTLHINNVCHLSSTLYFSGTRLRHVFGIKDQTVFPYARIPYGTHNSRPYKEGILLNDTSSDRVAFLKRTGKIIKAFPVKKFPENDLKMSGINKDHARQAFARGLCADDELIISGSSPATITVHHLQKSPVLKEINITMDIRNSIHGLEIWPY